MPASDERIVITLTTISPRIGALGNVIRSILDQTVPASEIRLQLSHEPYLLDQGIRDQDIPADIRDFAARGMIQISWVPNTGPYRKLLPALAHYWDRRDTILITADDDSIYPRDWIQGLVETHRRYPNEVIAHRCRRIKSGGGTFLPYVQWPYVESDAVLSGADLIPIGKDGVLYCPRFFTEDVFDEQALEICPFGDDLWFKFLALANDIRARAVGTCDARTGFPENSTGSKVALWNINRSPTARINNDVQIRRVFEYLNAKGHSLEKELGRPMSSWATNVRALKEISQARRIRRFFSKITGKAA